MTLTRDTQMSFGRYLQWCRKSKNLTLEVIAQDLKVGTGVLKAIENEDLSRMPEPVFAKGFLRGFARIVDADEARVIQDYLQRLNQFKRTILSSENMVRENDLFWKKLITSAVVVIILISLTVFVSTRHEEKVTGKGQTDKNKIVKTPVSTESPPGDYGDALNDTGNVVFPDDRESEAIRLSVVAVADTWLKINIDNKKNREYTLRPGDRLEFEALRGYNLLIGNAAGVKLFVNKAPLEIPREEGKVVNIDIP